MKKVVALGLLLIVFLSGCTGSQNILQNENSRQTASGTLGEFVQSMLVRFSIELARSEDPKRVFVIVRNIGDGDIKTGEIKAFVDNVEKPITNIIGKESYTEIKTGEWVSFDVIDVVKPCGKKLKILFSSWVDTEEIAC
jgi:hypothetical protein